MNENTKVQRAIKNRQEASLVYCANRTKRLLYTVYTSTNAISYYSSRKLTRPQYMKCVWTGPD